MSTSLCPKSGFSTECWRECLASAATWRRPASSVNCRNSCSIVFQIGVPMSKKYGSLERRIAKFLGQFPLLKSAVKAAYGRLVFLRNRPASKKVSNHQFVAVGDGILNTFFGYYDKTPLSEAGFVLC